MQHDSLCAAKSISPAWRSAVVRALAAAREFLTPAAPPAVVAPPGSRLALGLQGGGALGAFTWGVLDRLLEAPNFHPEAISGASAGAMNAVLLASGWLHGGRDGARELLERFWRHVGHLPSLWRGPTAVLGLDPGVALEMASTIVSPYDFNPLNHHPLRAILDELVDFERLREIDAPRLFISATDVQTGQARIFGNAELRLDCVLASACLPHLFHAVEIEGRPYWDGGYTANPPLEPLRAFQGKARLLLVLVNPRKRDGVPRTARDIADRLNQILGNAPLLRDLEQLRGYEAIELLTHGNGSASSAKYNNDWGFIRGLRDLGRNAAADWLAPPGA